MNIIELWMTHDWVVRILIIAFFTATLISMEKVYQLLTASRQIKRLGGEGLKAPYDAVMSSIGAFESQSESLYNANIGVQLEKIDMHLGRYVGFLGLIAVLSPMLGLIGTFFGVWHVFEGVGSFGLNDAAVIARGIKEVLVDTMAGLIVAVYATIFYKLFELWSRKLGIAFEERLYTLVKENHATPTTQRS